MDCFQRRTFLLVWFIYYLFPPILLAQTISIPAPREILDQDWRISSLLIEGGLENQYLAYIDFDSSGNAWIATAKGLFRYDGYTWKSYTTNDGLPSNFVRCILFAQNGMMWVGTDRGAGVFDGTSYQSLGSESGLSGQCIRRIREDPTGAIWLCGDSWPMNNDPGGLTSYKNGIWTQYDKNDGLPSNHVIDFFEDSKGRQFALTLNGLAQRDGKKWIQPLADRNFYGADDLFWSIVESPEYGVMAATGSSIFVLKDGAWTRHVSRYPRQYKLCQTRDGRIISCSDAGGKYHYFLEWDGKDFQPVSAGFKSPFREIGQICEAPDGSIWCAGFDCLTRWQRKGSEWTEYENIPPPVLVDGQNRVWFFAPNNTLLFDGVKWGAIDNPHTRIDKDIRGNVWGWSRNGVTQWKPGQTIQYQTRETRLKEPIGFNVDADGVVYFYGKDEQKRNLISTYDGSTWIPHIFPQFQEGSIQGSTPDANRGIWYLLSVNNDSSFQLLHMDGESLETLPVDPRITPPFPTYLRADGSDNLWLYGHFGLYQFQQKRLTSWSPIPEMLGRNVTSSALSPMDIWFGVTALRGGEGKLVRYHNGQFTYFFADPQELAVRNDDGSFLFAGDECIYQILGETQRIPHRLDIPTFGLIRNLLKDARDNIWIGMHGSVLKYICDRHPPDTRIDGTIKEIMEGGSLGVRIQGIKRFSPSDGKQNFLFSWQIDSEPWKQFQVIPERGISTSGLSPGQHILRVRAQDEGLYADPTPATFTFTIFPTPLQKRVWFPPLVSILGAIFFLLALNAFRTQYKLTHYAQNLESVVKERTASLREREATLNSIFRSAPIGIGLHANQIMQWTNDKLLEMTGYTSDELIDRSIRLLYPSDADYATCARFTYDSLSAHEIHSIETRWRRKDGTAIDVLVSSTLIDPQDASAGITFTALDITQRKQSAKTLEENERIFREAIEVAGAVPYYQNYATNRYDFVGPGIKELIGYSPEEFTPEIWSKVEREMILLGGLQGLSVEEAIQKARGEEGVSWRADYRIKTKDGVERWLSNSAVQVRDANHKIIGSLGILQEITERKILEEQLRQAQKMEAVGQLAGGVAHNINNLLTGIIGNQSLALMKATDEIRTYLLNASSAASRAAELVKELLAFSRKTRLELKPVNLNVEVYEVYRLIRETFDRRIEIVLETAPNLPNVLADASQIHSVLMNMCINARDAIEKTMKEPTDRERHGDSFRITLKTERKVLAREAVKVNPFDGSRDFVVIEIADNGTGIDETAQKHIFEPFFTTKETVGTGLGLASAFGILKQHNGWIDFKSTLGEGTTFQIYIPVTEHQTRKESNLQSSRGQLTGSETILFVDDEELIVNIGDEILKKSGYKILTASDGMEGWEAYLKEGDRIDLLILDLSMPKMSGLELMKKVLLLDPHKKIIISSGRADGYDTETLYKNGAAGSLAKPYQPIDLLRKVRTILDA